MGCCISSEAELKPSEHQKPGAEPRDKPGQIAASVYEVATSVSGATFRPSTAAYAGYGRGGKLHTGHRVIITEDHIFMCMFEGVCGYECANHLVRAAYGCFIACRVRCHGDAAEAMEIVMSELDESLQLASAASPTKAMSGAAAAIVVIDLRTQGLHAACIGGCSVLIARVQGSFNNVSVEPCVVADGRMHREAIDELRNSKTPDAAMLNRARAYVLGFSACKSKKAADQYARSTKTPTMSVLEPAPPLQPNVGSCQIMLGDEQVFLLSSGFQDLVSMHDVPILAHEFLPEEMQATLEAARPRRGVAPFISGRSPQEDDDASSRHESEPPTASARAGGGDGGRSQETSVAGDDDQPSPQLSMGSITSVQSGRSMASTMSAMAGHQRQRHGAANTGGVTATPKRRTAREQILAYDGAAPTPMSMRYTARTTPGRMSGTGAASGGSDGGGGSRTVQGRNTSMTSRKGPRDGTMARAVRGRFNVSEMLIRFAASQMWHKQGGQVAFSDHRTADLFAALRSDCMVLGITIQFPRSATSMRVFERRAEVALRVPKPVVAYRWHLFRQFARFIIARKRAVKALWHDLMRDMLDALDSHARQAEILAWQHMSEAIKVTRGGQVMAARPPLPAPAPSTSSVLLGPPSCPESVVSARQGRAPASLQPAGRPPAARNSEPAPLAQSAGPTPGVIATVTVASGGGGGARSGGARSAGGNGSSVRPPFHHAAAGSGGGSARVSGGGSHASGGARSGGARSPSPPTYVLRGLHARGYVNTSPTSEARSGMRGSRGDPDSSPRGSLDGEYVHDVSYLGGAVPKRSPSALPLGGSSSSTLHGGQQGPGGGGPLRGGGGSAGGGGYQHQGIVSGGGSVQGQQQQQQQGWWGNGPGQQGYQQQQQQQSPHGGWGGPQQGGGWNGPSGPQQQQQGGGGWNNGNGNGLPQGSYGQHGGSFQQGAPVGNSRSGPLPTQEPGGGPAAVSPQGSISGAFQGPGGWNGGPGGPGGHGAVSPQGSISGAPPGQGPGAWNSGAAPQQGGGGWSNGGPPQGYQQQGSFQGTPQGGWGNGPPQGYQQQGSFQGTPQGSWSNGSQQPGNNWGNGGPQGGWSNGPQQGGWSNGPQQQQQGGWGNGPQQGGWSNGPSQQQQHSEWGNGSQQGGWGNGGGPPQGSFQQPQGRGGPHTPSQHSGPGGLQDSEIRVEGLNDSDR
ncbi:hypothetical protein FOA52_009322 [Chlamydomonas sp. UWO 241]|nr:hypothetical protein FOA52_009322 [Chlamydomonas sp. UWO 241]